MNYPSIEAFGFGSGFGAAFADQAPEAANNHLWYIQEKIDGSNLTFRFRRESDETLKQPEELVFSCRHHDVKPDAEMFAKTCERIELLKPLLNSRYVYHGEAVRKCKHNVAEYVRIPRHYYVCFDIYFIDERRYLSPKEFLEECDRVGLEPVRFLYMNDNIGILPDKIMKGLIEQIEAGELESMLGGVPEGVVFKHDRFWYKDKYISSKRKMVTKKFKECQRKRQQKKGITADEFLRELGLCFAREARFAKARQHLEEKNLIDHTNGDRRRMAKELDADFDKEYREEIMTYLWQELGPVIKVTAKAGLNEWIDANMEIRAGGGATSVDLPEGEPILDGM